MKQYVYLLLGYIAVTAACNSDSKNSKSEIPAPAAAQAPRIMAPFRYHKTIEVSPGQYYDVLSWGRGSDSVGASQILRSDSAASKYTTTTGDLEGQVIDVFNADMDTDGNPELFIHTQATDSTHAAQVYAFEYNDDKARKLDFPRLTRSQKQGYRGNDHFYVKDDNLFREFEVFNEEDSLAKKPIQKRVIEYNLRGNSLSSHQVSIDSTTATKSDVPAAAATPSQSSTTPAKKSSNVSRGSSKKRTVSSKRRSSHRQETHRRKRRHR